MDPAVIVFHIDSARGETLGGLSVESWRAFVQASPRLILVDEAVLADAASAAPSRIYTGELMHDDAFGQSDERSGAKSDERSGAESDEQADTWRRVLEFDPSGLVSCDRFVELGGDEPIQAEDLALEFVKTVEGAVLGYLEGDQLDGLLLCRDGELHPVEDHGDIFG